MGEKIGILKILEKKERRRENKLLHKFKEVLFSLTAAAAEMVKQGL